MAAHDGGPSVPVRRSTRYLSGLVKGAAFGFVGGVCGFVLSALYARYWLCREAAAVLDGNEEGCGVGPLFLAYLGFVVVGSVAAIVGAVHGYRHPVVEWISAPSGDSDDAQQAETDVADPRQGVAVPVARATAVVSIVLGVLALPQVLLFPTSALIFGVLALALGLLAGRRLADSSLLSGLGPVLGGVALVGTVFLHPLY